MFGVDADTTHQVDLRILTLSVLLSAGSVRIKVAVIQDKIQDDHFWLVFNSLQSKKGVPTAVYSGRLQLQHDFAECEHNDKGEQNQNR